MSETHGNPGDKHHTPAALPEPKTPMWLPALGAVLFLLAGIAWAMAPGGTEDPTGDAGAATGR